MRSHVRVALLGLGMLLAACGGAAEDRGADDSIATTTVPASTSSTNGDTTTTEDRMVEESDLVRAAIRDLASRLDRTEAEIEVVEVRDVQWPDGSLGCPEEGKVYTQAIVDGTQVLLGADGRIYDYHAGDDDVPFLCPSEEKDGGYDFVPPPGFDE